MGTQALQHGSASGIHESDQEIAAFFLCRATALPFTLRAAIKLGVPDIMKEAGPGTKLTAEEIASRIVTPKGTPADSENLGRMLRLLASHNVVTELLSPSPKDPKVVERRYAATRTLECLTETGAGSLASLLLIATNPRLVACLEHLHEAIWDRIVQPFVFANGLGLYEYFKTDSALDKDLNKSMGDASTLIMSKLLEKYTGFEGLNSLADVGGGIGANLVLILSKHPRLRGINFDQPHTVAKGLQVPGLEHIGGDFFKAVPEADAVLMKWILHDWSDEHCITILKNIAKALPPHGKVINIDILLPEVSDTSTQTQSGLANDILMLAYCDSGKERTLSQFRKIAAAAGFPRVEIAATVFEETVLEFYKS